MRKWYPASLVIVTIVISAIVYPRLPDQVPRLWTLSSEPNASWSKTTATLAGPLILIALWIVMQLLPRIDPRRANYARMSPTWDLVVDAFLTAIAVLHFIAIAYALNAPIEFERVMPAVVGSI